MRLARRYAEGRGMSPFDSPEERIRAAGGRTELAEPAPTPGEPLPGLRDFLSVEAWAERDMPPADRLLGDLVTTTTRMFLVGRTGLGKTLLALALATGMANGEGFMHWRSSRRARVLVIDGEMPGELIRQRAVEALRRAGMPPPPGGLMIYARDMEDAFAERFPAIGRMPPLNMEAGHNWVLALIAALGGVDVVIFDNVMSLIGGDQKDEVPWTETLPLVQSLTGKRIGQIWLDHTGHNQDRQYGSSTKAWRFDAVGIMAPLPDDQAQRGEVAFTLSFDHPGKARRRTPANWQDFETVTIRLLDDRWTSEAASKVSAAVRGLSPTAAQFHKALLDALAAADTPGKTTRTAWYAECVRTGLATAIEVEDDHRAKEAKRFRFRKYVTELRTAGLIGVDGEAVTDLRRDA
jgi:AAA domain